MSGTVPRSTTCANSLTATFNFKPQPTKYVRFVATSYYGTSGAALEYFNIGGPPMCCKKQ